MNPINQLIGLKLSFFIRVLDPNCLLAKKILLELPRGLQQLRLVMMLPTNPPTGNYLSLLAFFLDSNWMPINKSVMAWPKCLLQLWPATIPTSQPTESYLSFIARVLHSNWILAKIIVRVPTMDLITIIILQVLPKDPIRQWFYFVALSLQLPKMIITKLQISMPKGRYFILLNSVLSDSNFQVTF